MSTKLLLSLHKILESDSTPHLIFTWCEDIFGDSETSKRWKVENNSRISDGYYYQKITYIFQSKEDAVLFKLRWGDLAYELE